MGLTVLITGADGVVRRCAPDEPDSAWVPFGITFESALPGGWKSGGFSLRQRIDQDLGLRLLQEVVFLDEDGETVYEGRIVKLPRSHGDDYLLGVECLGWASHMLDDPSVPYFYVQRDLSGWSEPPLDERTRKATANEELEKSYTATVEQGGLGFNGPEGIAVPQFSESQRWYVLPVGQTLAKFMYRGVQSNTTSVETATLYTEDDPGTNTLTAQATLTLDDTVRSASQAIMERNVLLRALSTAGHTPTAPFSRTFKAIGLCGNHGLTSRPISGNLDGYLIDEMLVHALNAGAPRLTAKTVANGGLIEAPGLVVGQAADNELGTVERIVLDLNKYVLFEWGVYKNREFFYRKTDPDRCCWEARLERGAHLSLEGDDAEHALNGMMIRYTLADGIPRIAGPVGSGLDVESALLGDTDPENTANQMGYPRKWGDQTISFPLADDSYAIVIGAAYLAQAALPARSGDIELVWECEHPTKGMRPVREVLAGDYIRLSDHPSDLPRRIINTNNREDGRQNTVTVGNDMNKVDAILEQLGVVTTVNVG